MDRKYFLITPFILFILLSFAIPIQAIETFTDDFNTPHNYLLVDSVIGNGWDGLSGMYIK